MNNLLTIEDITIEDLPESLQKLAHIIGLRNTVNLVNSIGGTRVFIPKKPNPASRIGRYIDADGLRKLTDVFPGVTLSIATGSGTKTKIRNRRIISDFCRHVSVRAIARNEGLTERQVYSILNCLI